MPGEPETKICKQCKTEKPIEEFGILRSSEDGHNRLCFACKRQRQREYDSKGKRANKDKFVRDRKPETEKPKIPQSPEKETAVQHEEPSEAQLMKTLKKNIIKNFIRSDLIPMLERTVEEKFN